MALSLSACLGDKPYGDGDDTGGNTPSGETAYTLGTPVSYSTNLDGLSAICLNEAGNGLLIARDNGDVLEYDLDGSRMATNTMPNPDGRSKVDLEGITKAADGSIYLCEERFREVWKLNADHKGMTLLSKGPTEAQNEDNQGFEGIAAGPDGLLYVANQSKPFRVYTYSTKTKAWGTAFALTSPGRRACPTSILTSMTGRFGSRMLKRRNSRSSRRTAPSSATSTFPS